MSILQLLFFLAKKVAKKAKTAETYPRTRPMPARSAVVPPTSNKWNSVLWLEFRD
jgi:hypothetical protein